MRRRRPWVRIPLVNSQMWRKVKRIFDGIFRLTGLLLHGLLLLKETGELRKESTRDVSDWRYASACIFWQFVCDSLFVKSKIIDFLFCQTDGASALHNRLIWNFSSFVPSSEEMFLQIEPGSHLLTVRSRLNAGSKIWTNRIWRRSWNHTKRRLRARELKSATARCVADRRRIDELYGRPRVIWRRSDWADPVHGSTQCNKMGRNKTRRTWLSATWLFANGTKQRIRIFSWFIPRTHAWSFGTSEMRQAGSD